MNVRWDVKARAIEKGWVNAHQLAARAGISYPVAKRIWDEEEMPDRIDFDTLGKLAKTFGCKRNPWKLLKIVSHD
ncbi:MAG: hypothetical protein JWM95_1738 [Gemmatimonadetes bacterium]|nr:hypothetical protein [Gemmatimonadota bacterium]